MWGPGVVLGSLQVCLPALLPPAQPPVLPPLPLHPCPPAERLLPQTKQPPASCSQLAGTVGRWALRRLAACCHCRWPACPCAAAAAAGPACCAMPCCSWCSLSSSSPATATPCPASLAVCTITDSGAQQASGIDGSHSLCVWPRLLPLLLLSAACCAALQAAPIMPSPAEHRQSSSSMK